MWQVDRDMPAVVPLPAEIDLTNAEEVSDQIGSVLEPGVSAVVADLTATTFCDSSGLRHLLLAHEIASANGIQLRFAVPLDCPVRRILAITDAGRVLDIYQSLDEAIIGRFPSTPPPSSKAGFRLG